MTTPLLRQTWTMSAVLINMFGQAMVLSYPSSLLVALNRPDSPIKVDLHSSSWLGSILGVAGIPGFLLSSLLMFLYGRRFTHGLAISPAIIGWLLIYYANDVPMLLVGRFLGGLSSTATVTLGAIVIAEYTSPEYRGVYLYLKNAIVCLGALFTHILSHYLDWRTIALVAQIPLIISLLIIFTWPESPSWLASKHEYEKSKDSFYWLRGTSDAARKEIEDILKAQKAKQLAPKVNSTSCDMILNFFQKFTERDFLKPFFIMVLAAIILEMCGRHIFPAYALHIVKEITGETTQAYYYSFAIDAVITLSALFATVLVKIFNRRTLLFYSGFISLVLLTTLCLYLFLACREIIPKDKIWPPVFLLILYFIFANLGCAPIPIALVGEVFPLAHRGVGAALSGIWISLCLLVGLKSTPHLLDSTGVHGLFAVYGSIMGVSLLILYFILPETKDRTLQEIENYFNYGKFTIDSDDDEEAKIKMIKE